MVIVLLELNHSNKYDECSIRVYRSLIIFLAKRFPFMLAFCLMLLATHYAQNYAAIIGWSLAICINDILACMEIMLTSIINDYYCMSKLLGA